MIMSELIPHASPIFAADLSETDRHLIENGLLKSYPEKKREDLHYFWIILELTESNDGAADKLLDTITDLEDARIIPKASAIVSFPDRCLLAWSLTKPMAEQSAEELQRINFALKAITRSIETWVVFQCKLVAMKMRATLN